MTFDEFIRNTNALFALGRHWAAEHDEEDGDVHVLQFFDARPSVGTLPRNSHSRR